MDDTCSECGAHSNANDLGFCPCCRWESDWYSDGYDFDECDPFTPPRNWKVTVILTSYLWDDDKFDHKTVVKRVTFKSLNAHTEQDAHELAMDRFECTHGVGPHGSDYCAEAVLVA